MNLMHKKKLRQISLLLFFTFLLNLCVPCFSVQAEVIFLSDAPIEKGIFSASEDSGVKEVSFGDTAGHWAENGIKAWAARELVGGYPDGTFRPDSPITRAEFLTLVNRAFGYTAAGQGAGGMNTAVDSSGSFWGAYKDIAVTDWYAGEIAKAAAVGYLGGYPDGTVKPQNPITRQEVAAVFARILPLANFGKDKNKDSNNDTVDSLSDTKVKFVDQAQIPAWSQAAIAAAVSGGYMNGYPDGTFQPAKPITRAEAVASLERAVGTLYNRAGTYGPFQGTALLEGNVTVNTPGVTLQNTTITGNLYLTEGIGAGDVTLDNVTVQGITKISGGGSNSIHLLNTTIGAVLVNVPSRHLVRLLAQGSTDVGTLEARTPAKLEEEGLTGSGFTKVIVKTSKNLAGVILAEGSNTPQSPTINVELLGQFSDVEIQAAAAQLDLQKGSIANLTLSSTAQAAQINLAAQTSINTLTADTPATVQGQGTVETTQANVDGVVIEAPAKKVFLADGVQANVAGKTITEDYKYVEPKKKKSRDAALSDLMIDGITVAGFAPDTLSYDVVLPYGTTEEEIPTVTAEAHHAKARITITPATTLPGSTTVLVTAESGKTQTYTVSFTVAENFAKKITSFKFEGFDPDVMGTINEEAKTIVLTVPYETDVAALTPTITYIGASISPDSGVEQDFTNPVIYTVTAEDDTTQAYTVTVSKAAAVDAVIDIAAIAGVTAPVRDAAPVATITETDQYTGTVSWSPEIADNKFAASTEYTATITLSPKAGYTLTGITENFFTVEGATATNAANSGVITAVFPATEAVPDAVIDIAAIAGVTAPVRDAAPVATITETDQYTGTVSWSPEIADNKFAASTVYTATITLSPKAGYTLTGITENFFTVEGATATNAANSGVITAVFPATEAVPDAVIDIAAIAGVTAPVRDAAPVATITETDQYTGTVSWSPEIADNKFAASTEYTATITLSPKAGYTLTGITENFFTVEGATATNAANSGVITAVFPATEAVPDAVIDIAAIAGVTAPVRDAAPVATITETDQYTGTVSWSPEIADNKFAASTEYTATITLSPKAGYTLTGITENFFTVEGATATNAANSGVITAVFPATEAVPDAVIDIAAIAGVTAPVRDAAPVATITETDQYTGTVSWSPEIADNKFAASTVYTATITLSPKAGYTLTGITENFFTVEGATATNAANSGVITAVFPATEAVPDAVIDIAAIAGVTAPVRDAAPVATITETDQYTGTVSWSPEIADNKFAASTVYTATITLSPKAGYTLTGITENFFTVEGATATNAANSGVITAVFPATEAVPDAVIDIAAIAGVTAPVRDAAPVATITETDQYTGTVSWSPEIADNKFAASTVYTATITLSPKAGYTLTGITENFFTVEGATATNAANSGVITAVFPATEAVPDAVIDIAAIAGVTAPVRDAAPVATITETDQYTGTVSWSPEIADNKFAASTVYTATITLSPKAGYTLTGITENFFTVEGATATNAANSGVITAVFPATEAVPDAVIDIAAIAGVTAPVTGETPVATITETAQYTGIVSWSPEIADNKFAASTVYTATITLTAKEGYTLTGVAADFFTVAGATAVNNAADSGVVTAVFPATAATYGVSWTSGTNTSMTRLGAAEDFTDNTPFSGINPWSEMKLCNVSDEGTITAYIDDGTSNFKRDGTNGQVMVKIPKFYYKHTYDEETKKHEFWVADGPAAGFKLHPAFIRAGVEKEYILMGAYKASLGRNQTDTVDALASVSGAFPAVSKNITQFRTLAEARGTGTETGANWTQVDALTRNAVALLYLVEYADTNSQSTTVGIGKGITELRWSTDDRVTVASTNANEIIVSSTTAGHYSTGQIIGVGTSLGNGSVCTNRMITGIAAPVDGNVTITVDGTEFSTTTDPVNYIYHVAQKTGGCDELDGVSGSAATYSDGVTPGVNGKVSINYRGLEDLWGNVWEFVDGINIKADHRPYVADHGFASDVFDGTIYQDAGFNLPGTNNWVNNFACSAGADWLLMPSAVGADSGYIPDYYYQATGNRVALVGGRWTDGATAGLFRWNVYAASSSATLDVGGRLLQIP